MGFQFILSDKIISLLCGKARDSIPFALSYAKIRSLAAPFAVPTIVGQAAFLGAKDAVTPLKAVLVGAVVNIIGDILLVSVLGTGVSGAAAATTASQMMGALYLLFVAIDNVAKANKTSLFSLKLLQSLKKYVYIPSSKDIARYLAFCGPLFVILLVKTVLWTYTTFACSSAGAVELAAHQIMINFFLFFCIFGDVISQISQTYLPYFLADYDKFRENGSKPNQNGSGQGEGELLREKKESGKSSLISVPALKEMVQKVCSIGSFFGLFNALVCLSIEKFGYGYFTSSKEVISKLQSASKLLILSVVPHALMLALEGTVFLFPIINFYIVLKRY